MFNTGKRYKYKHFMEYFKPVSKGKNNSTEYVI